MTALDRAVGAEWWDTEWAAEKASEALHYLARNYPECAASEVLREHEEAAHEAAMDADEEVQRRPQSLLPGWSRRGQALRIRRHAA